MKIEELNTQSYSLNHISICFSELTEIKRQTIMKKLFRVGNKVMIDETTLIVLFDSFELEKQINHWDDPNEKAQLQQILNRQKIVWSGAHFNFDLTNQPIVYTIMNITPDSFHDGAQENLNVDSFLKKVENQLIDGASVIELGGKSSRPGYLDITPNQEWLRLEKPLKALKKQFPDVTVAIDTDEPEVMERVLDCGVDIINDIDGFDTDEKLKVIEQYRPSVVAMNNGRTPFLYSDDVFEELSGFYEHKKQELLHTGLKKEQICTDPGVGFYDPNRGGDSLERAKSSELLSRFGLPVMIAISHKRFLSQDFGFSDQDRGFGNLMLEAQMIADGGRVLRVHDTKDTKLLIDGFKKYKQA